MSHFIYPIRNFHLPLNKVWEGRVKEWEGTSPVIGLEFENELPFSVDFGSIPGWKFHQEHSLRDFGYEFVSTKPVSRFLIEKSIALLFKKIQNTLDQVEEITKTKLTPSNSIRTSVHVHLDATNLTHIQILNFALIYWLLEDFLTSYCGETRRGNLFCLRLRDATYQKYCMLLEIKDLAPFSSSGFTDNMRYASLNLAAVKKFCSLESRLLRGTTDVNVVMTWIDCLLAIYHFALKFSTPKDIQKDFLNSCNAKDYPLHVLGFGLCNKMSNMMEVPLVPYQIAKDIRENYVELVELFNASETFDFRAQAVIQDKEIEAENKIVAAHYEKSIEKLTKLKPGAIQYISTAPTSPWASIDEMPANAPDLDGNHPTPQEEF